MNINELKPVLCLFAPICGCSSPAIPDADIVFVNSDLYTLDARQAGVCHFGGWT